MATVYYNILSGAPNFLVELTPSSIPSNINTAIGTYYFDNVPDGEYTLKITDSNNCVFSQVVVVDSQNITTTTTTINPMPDDSIIIGNTDDQTLIFNEVATNRNSHYVGYPNEDISTLYLWFKTTDGLPLTIQKSINYTIETSINSENLVSIINNSNNINSEIIENLRGPNLAINGNIIFNVGFIETCITYCVVNNSNDPSFKIELNSVKNDFNYNIPVVGVNNQYGIIYNSCNNMILEF
jgi:hypothetical protein